MRKTGAYLASVWLLLGAFGCDETRKGAGSTSNLLHASAPMQLETAGAPAAAAAAALAGASAYNGAGDPGRPMFDGDPRAAGSPNPGAVYAGGAAGKPVVVNAAVAANTLAINEPPAPAGPMPAPQTPLDQLFYSYGSACYGMDWRFLKAVAKAESGLDPKNHTGKYVGLFQLEPESGPGHTCDMFIDPFRKYLDCSNLEDAETNVAVSAHRFDRYFTAQRNFARDGSWIGINEACPNATAEEAAALAYVGHNNGPGVLKWVLARVPAHGGCRLSEQEAAVRSFYSNPGLGNTDGVFEKPKDGEAPEACPNQEALRGKWSYHCISEDYGASKWRYGVEKVARPLKQAGVATLYPAGVKDPSRCPALMSPPRRVAAPAVASNP